MIPDTDKAYIAGLFDGENLKADSINKGRLYPKFTCEPYTPEQAET